MLKTKNWDDNEETNLLFSPAKQQKAMWDSLFKVTDIFNAHVHAGCHKVAENPLDLPTLFLHSSNDNVIGSPKMLEQVSDVIFRH